MILTNLLFYLFGQKDTEWPDHERTSSVNSNCDVNKNCSAETSSAPHRNYDTIDLVLDLLELFCVALIIFTFVSNLVTIVCTLCTKSLRHITNAYLVSLAFADIAVSIMVMPFGAFVSLNNGSWELGCITCQTYVLSDVLFCTSSVLHLVSIAFDKFHAVKWPMENITLNKHRRVPATLALIWFFSLIATLSLYFANDWDTEPGSVITCVITPNAFMLIWSIAAFYFPLVLICFLYAAIYVTARTSIRAGRSKSSNKGLNSMRSHLNSKSASSREKRSTRIMAMVIGAFIVCWLPVKLLDVYEVLGFSQSPPRELQSFFLMMAYANSAVNPIIYAAFSLQFRKAFRGFACRGERRQTITSLRSQRVTQATRV